MKTKLAILSVYQKGETLSQISLCLSYEVNKLDVNKLEVKKSIMGHS